MIRRLLPSALGLLLLAACEQKAAPTPEETATPSVPVPTTTPATTAPQEQQAQEIDDGLKLEQDFEEQAYEQITDENTLPELDKVEKEIKDAEKVVPPAGAAKAAAPTAGGATPPSGAATPKPATPAPAPAKPAAQ